MDCSIESILAHALCFLSTNTSEVENVSIFRI